jgi:hypothetical protein
VEITKRRSEYEAGRRFRPPVSGNNSYEAEICSLMPERPKGAL